MERICAYCGKPIKYGESWTIKDGKYYHTSCLERGKIKSNENKTELEFSVNRLIEIIRNELSKRGITYENEIIKEAQNKIEIIYEKVYIPPERFFCIDEIRIRILKHFDYYVVQIFGEDLPSEIGELFPIVNELIEVKKTIMDTIRTETGKKVLGGFI